MAERSAKRNEYVLDPMFQIPEGTDEFVYDENATITEEETLDEFFLEDGETGSVPDDTTLIDDGGVEGVGPRAPEAFAIVSQTLRTAPGGQQVVDLIIDVTDVPGISEYEFRVTEV